MVQGFTISHFNLCLEGFLSICRQVFWLPGLPTPRFLPIPLERNSGNLSGFVSGYSGGTAPAFDGFPFSSAKERKPTA